MFKCVTSFLQNYISSTCRLLRLRGVIARALPNALPEKSVCAIYCTPKICKLYLILSNLIIFYTVLLHREQSLTTVLLIENETLFLDEKYSISFI